MRLFRLLILALPVALLSSGCSLMAPHYTASLDNVQRLKDGGATPARVGRFESSADKANANPISIRGSMLQSPYEESFAVYLAEAIRQELSLAGRLAPGTDIEISGTLLKNDIDATGFSVGSGVIEARFVITRGGAGRYSQVKSVNYTWESSFVGAVAIPRAQQEYPRMVQRLLAELYADPAFLQALR